MFLPALSGLFTLVLRGENLEKLAAQMCDFFGLLGLGTKQVLPGHSRVAQGVCKGMGRDPPCLDILVASFPSVQLGTWAILDLSSSL